MLGQEKTQYPSSPPLCRLSPPGYIYLSNQLPTIRLIEKYRKNNKKRVRHIKDTQDLLSECGASLSSFLVMCACVSVNVCVCTSLSEYILPTKTHRFVQNNVWVSNMSVLHYAALRNEKVYTAKHTLLLTTDIKVFLYMNLPGNCRSTDVGERSEDVIEWFGSERTLLVFVYVTLNKKQT